MTQDPNEKPSRKVSDRDRRVQEERDSRDSRKVRHIKLEHLEQLEHAELMDPGEYF